MAKDNNLIAKLVTLEDGGKAPIFIKPLIKSVAAFSYENIPVIILDYWSEELYEKNYSLTIDGEVMRPANIKTVKWISDAIEDASESIDFEDLYSPIKMWIVFETVSNIEDLHSFAKSEAFSDLFSFCNPTKSGIIKLDRITKFKHKWGKPKIEGLLHIDNHIDNEDDDSDELKSFVVDPKEDDNT